MRVIYVCDPQKNDRCRKTGCGYSGRGLCYHTFSRDDARVGLFGMPRVALWLTLKWSPILRNKVTNEIGHCFYCLKWEFLKR